MWGTDLTNPPLDWEEAYRQAASAGLLVHTAHPLNAETPLPALIAADVTPAHHFYVRDLPIPPWTRRSRGSPSVATCCAAGPTASRSCVRCDRTPGS
jgi:hypothetical protein